MSEGRKSEAVPLLATERNPQRETVGHRDAKVGLHLGTPFIPWQRDAADIFGEIDPATGCPWYLQAVIILQRQVGKTTFIRARLTRRAVTTPNAVIRYTAQTRLMASGRLENDFWKPLSESKLAVFLDQNAGRRSGKIGFSGSTGEEHIAFGNGARWSVDAVKSTSGHGPTLHDGAIDEAFAHKTGAIEAAMIPAMQNVDDAQLLVASAAGDTESTYLRLKVDALSELVRTENAKPMHQRRSRTAFIMYGAPPDADPNDPETYWRTHPGVGYLTTVDRIMAAREAFILNGEPEEADRAYLSWWPTKRAPDPVIPVLLWNDCGVEDPEDVEWTSAPVWSLDVSPDRDFSSVGLAVTTPGARAWLECVEQAPGTHWVVRYLVKLRTEFGGNTVALDGTGPAAALIADLEKEGFDVRRLSLGEQAQACGGLYDDAVSTLIRHGSDPVLNTALAAAVKRTSSGEAFVWARRPSMGDITPLYAVTIARFVLIERVGDDYDVLDSIR